MAHIHIVTKCCQPSADAGNALAQIGHQSEMLLPTRLGRHPQSSQNRRPQSVTRHIMPEVVARPSIRTNTSADLPPDASSQLTVTRAACVAPSSLESRTASLDTAAHRSTTRTEHNGEDKWHTWVAPPPSPESDDYSDGAPPTALVPIERRPKQEQSKDCDSSGLPNTSWTYASFGHRCTETPEHKQGYARQSGADIPNRPHRTSPKTPKPQWVAHHLFGVTDDQSTRPECGALSASDGASILTAPQDVSTYP